MFLGCSDMLRLDQSRYPDKKLSLYGIQGAELAWFKNNLKERQQFASLNGEASSSQMIKTGVPQGSVFGPFLFIVYINDLPKHVMNAHSNIFADSVIYRTGKSANETRRVMQESVLETWKRYIDKNLPVNTLKTIRTLASSSSYLNKIADADDILNLSLQDYPLSQVRRELSRSGDGIKVDMCLKWDVHVLYLCKKVAFNEVLDKRNGYDHGYPLRFVYTSLRSRSSV